MCLFETGNCSHPFVKSIELISYTSFSQPLLEGHLFYYEKAVTVIHSLKFTDFSVVASRCRNSNLATNYGIFLAAALLYWNIGRLLYYLMTSFKAIHLFYGTVIILSSLCHGINWSDPSYQGYCVYVTTLIPTVPCVKWNVVTWRAFEKHCIYLRKTIATLFS